MKRGQTQKGFTIVELLIVIVVIGIIAAISLVAYSQVDKQAASVSARATQLQFTKSAEAFKVLNDTYPTSITDCPTPAAMNICVPLKTGQALSYFVFGSDVPPRYAAALHRAAPAYEIEFRDNKSFFYSSNAEMTHTNEFMQYMDMAPIIDKYGLQKYKISFDIKSANIASQNTVSVYMQNGSGARYNFGVSVPVTTSFTRQSITVTPTGPNAGFTQSILAFYGLYGTGNISTVRNVTIEQG